MPSLIDLYNLIIEDNSNKYTIFCDLDRVLVDFDKGYQSLTGLSTKHSDVQNSEDFWDLFNDKLKEKNKTEYWFWSTLPMMSDGLELWNYIKPTNPYILTAPSRNPESKEGKLKWFQDNLGYVRKMIFSPSYKKKLYAKPFNILIDDMKDNINGWNENRGIGIYHQSTLKTIKELKQLGI
jgi:5'(3')-deoxyribonucleotidase